MNIIYIVLIVFFILLIYLTNGLKNEVLVLLVIPFTGIFLMFPNKRIYGDKDFIDEGMSEELNDSEGVCEEPIDKMLDIPTYKRQYDDKDFIDKEINQDVNTSEVVGKKLVDKMLDIPAYKRQKKSIDKPIKNSSVKELNKTVRRKAKKSRPSKLTKSLRALISHVKLKYFTKKSKSILCLIGVGGGGSNILSDLSVIDDKHKYIHINSDNNALRQKQSEYKVLLTSDNKKDKWGCGGNTDCGMNLIDNKVKEKLDTYTSGYQTIYLIATLGGGVGSGSTPEIAKYLKTINKKVIMYVTLPFSFEGNSRLTTAQTSLLELKKYADQIIVLENNDLLKSNKGLRETFKLSSIDIYSRILNEY